MGPLELSVIWSSRVSALQGFLMYCRLWRNDWGHKKCQTVIFITGVRYLGVSAKRGFTFLQKEALKMLYIIYYSSQTETVNLSAVQL